MGDKKRILPQETGSKGHPATRSNKVRPKVKVIFESIVDRRFKVYTKAREK